MPINPSIGSAAVALQTDRDTPASTPAFKHGLTGGSAFSAERSIASTPVACGNRAPSDARVDSISVGGSIETLCYPDVLGFYLYAALGAVKSAAASKSGYRRHIFTMGDTLPYVTVWSQIGTNNFTQAVGCKVSKLELSASGNEPIALKAELAGIDGKVGIDGIPGSLEASCYGGKFVPTDCDVRLDTASGTPKEALVADLSFNIENGTSALSSLGRVTPRDIADGTVKVGISVTTIPDDIKPYQKMITGSESAVNISGKIVFGSVYAKFIHSEDPNMTLELKLDHIPFTASFPSVDPEGTEGTIQFTCDSAIITSAGESPATVTLVNKTESYVLPAKKHE
ncbi:hypothetical protein K6V98_00170 [Collinsella sp. AGMB00827]|uniref:Uncharacterized protein n=1 Tax=Collinsella ureilytica TaxID=2869515 RepID=A0ABS7MHF3_9ACTN|nr:phage tail tube protein [Collinsella urealyticum]MBY4796785.1 hypothetical protein [Collinsella urealyticum]